MQSGALAMPSRRPRKAFWVWAGLAGPAAVVVAAEVAAYSWRPWYLSNNVLLAAEAMLALAFAVGVAVWRQQSSQGHAG